jgi:hypothetical protein
MTRHTGTTRSLVRIGSATLALLTLSSAAWAQADLTPPLTNEVNPSGPRFGLTMLSHGNIDTLREHDIHVRSIVSQFGWQFEKRVYSGDGVTALTEWVPLISGLDQGVVLPSLNWLVGVRTASGTEFGIGPNITPVGVGLVVAGGVTVRQGGLNVPLNFALVTSKSGPRFTMLTGFNLRR